LENDVKGEINAIVGRAVIELLMLHNTVSCELKLMSLIQASPTLSKQMIE
jgi:hypothetical protein